ncbi:MAG: Lrp/AsnC family transcriptional regulator [Pseudonocardia sp.]
MTSDRSISGSNLPVPPKDVRPGLDETDRAILAVLRTDARIPNKLLAERVGIAASTCLARVRGLRERSVIRGYYADVDPKALGHDLQAMIAIRLDSQARSHIRQMITGLSRQPEVLDVYFVAGANDYLVHVAVASTEELRRFVADHLSRNPDIGYTETSLIFEHIRADGH